MSVFHLTCWKKKVLRETGQESKANGWASRPGYSVPCGECGIKITPGEQITYPRRGRFAGKAAQEAGVTTEQGDDSEHEENETTEETEERAEQATQATERKTETRKAGSADGIAQAIADLVMPVLESRLEDAISGLNVKTLVASVVAEATKALGDIGVRRVEVTRWDGTKEDIGVQHKQFDELMYYVVARTNVWLYGPAGSGKTTAARMVAKACNLRFFYTGAFNDSYTLTGYNNAHGDYVRTLFREAWEHGGVFLLDEIDACDPNALTGLNAALGNGHCAFPDGVVEKHPDCVIIAAANTWGLGATNEYVGRNRQDGASLDRYAYLGWTYDEALERQTCGNPEWCDRVQEVRRKVQARGIKVLVTPRASYMGARLLAAGMPRAKVEEAVLRKGMTDEQWKSILS